MKVLTLLNDVSHSVQKYPISTFGAVFSGVEFKVFSPVLVQIMLLMVDYLRTKYIKKERTKELEKIHQFGNEKTKDCNCEKLKKDE